MRPKVHSPSDRQCSLTSSDEQAGNSEPDFVLHFHAVFCAKNSVWGCIRPGLHACSSMHFPNLQHQPPGQQQPGFLCVLCQQRSSMTYNMPTADDQ